MPTDEPVPTGRDAAANGGRPTDQAPAPTPGVDTAHPEGGGDPYYPDDSIYPGGAGTSE